MIFLKISINFVEKQTESVIIIITHHIQSILLIETAVSEIIFKAQIISS